MAELRVVPTPPPDAEGRPVVVHFRPDGEPLGHHEPPGDGLTAGLLKDELVVGRHIYEYFPRALRQARDSAVWSLPVVFEGKDGEVKQETTLFDLYFGSRGFDPEVKPKRPRRGPKGWPDEDYARLADAYLKACESGSRSPVADVAAERGMTADALRQALHRARRRGLLTRQTTGRAGGELTPRARALL
ncbi:MAG: hypothetical protein ACRD2Z_09610, partial [Thermoanaerobaculia bacterium]